MRKGSIVIAALVSAAPLWVEAANAAPTPYDGSWSVSIITDSGSCDRGYRYALHIKDGRIYYDDPSFDVSGMVNPRGQVAVTVRYGDQVANGTGRLFTDYGQGVWSGRSPSSQCSGHWEAERRPGVNP
jgi:hypothetical protein